MFVLRAESSFCAAHKLIGYNGACQRLHGHNWKISLSIKTEIVDEIGIGCDFKILKKILESILIPFDHQDLNSISPFDKMNPTAENIAKFIYNEAKNYLPENVFMECVEVYESEKNYLKYYE